MTMHERGGDSAARQRMSVVRFEMAEAMAQLLETAAESYRCFAALCPKSTSISEKEVKKFNAHHAACRSALAHIERLIRIQKWAMGSIEDERDASDASALVAHARTILEDYPSEDE